MKEIFQFLKDISGDLWVVVKYAALIGILIWIASMMGYPK